jgi:hypothetical protein
MVCSSTIGEEVPKYPFSHKHFSCSSVIISAFFNQSNTLFTLFLHHVIYNGFKISEIWMRENIYVFAITLEVAL